MKREAGNTLFPPTTPNNERVGIYGGSFSPPHNGHLHAVRAFLSEEALDRLLVIPAHTPPHKALDGEATPLDRLTMCRLAFDFDKRIEVSDIELVRDGVSYTVDTLKALSKLGRTLILFMGTDMFLTLDKWRAPEEIFALAEVVYIRRESDNSLTAALRQKEALYEKRYGATVREITLPPLPLSSSEIRENRTNKNFLEASLPEKVMEYIQKWNLYTT